jgi:hypothetical protein
MADRLEIVDALESLAVHCRLPLMDIDARSRWTQTWCEDLLEFPLPAIQNACRRWRQSDNTKFPTPGQLLPMVRAAVRTPNPDATGHAKPWTWPSDADLDAMSLEERRRNYLIMASETRGKAGPMNDAGEHPRPEWIGKARAYADEARRIAGYISRSAQKRSDSAA